MEHLKWHVVCKTTHVSWFWRADFCSENSPERGWDEEKRAEGGAFDTAHLHARWPHGGKTHTCDVGQCHDVSFEGCLLNEILQALNWPLVTLQNSLRKNHPRLFQDCTMHFYHAPSCVFVASSFSSSHEESLSLQSVPLTWTLRMTNVSVAGNPHKTTDYRLENNTLLWLGLAQGYVVARPVTTQPTVTVT